MSLHFYSKSKRYFGPSFHLYKQFVDLRHIFGEKKCSFAFLQQIKKKLCSFQLTPSDTLAGIAIKYNVSVEDLKRCNGLVNDWDLWMRTGTEVKAG